MGGLGSLLPFRDGTRAAAAPPAPPFLAAPPAPAVALAAADACCLPGTGRGGGSEDLPLCVLAALPAPLRSCSFLLLSRSARRADAMRPSAVQRAEACV